MSNSSASSESTPAPPVLAAAPSASAAEGRGPWLAFLGCGLIWGSTFLVISIGNDTLPPMWAVAIRLALAFPVLSLVMKLTGNSYPRGPALKAAALFGICQFGLDLPLLYWGEKTVPSGLAAVLFATVPLSSAVIARLFRIEKLNPLKIVGAFVAIGGIALIGGADSTHGGNLLGIAAILGAATVAGLGTTYLKLGPTQSPWGVNAVGCLFGLPMCLAASLLLHEKWIVPPTPASWFSILYLVLLGSCGAYALMAWLVHRWPVTRIAFIAVIVPIIALLLGALVRHEPLSGRSLAGAAVVLVGLACGMAADRGKVGAH